ncbi:MAG: peptidase M48, partial [Rhodanobacter sp.]
GTAADEAPPALAASSTGAARAAPPLLGAGGVALPVLVAAGVGAAAEPASALAESAIDRAVTLRRNLPETLTAKVQDPDSAQVIVLAIVLSAQADIRERQLRLLADAFGDDVEHATVAMSSDLESLSPELRLPLVALATPALKRLSPGRLQTFLSALDDIVHLDSCVNLGEYCLTRLLRMQLLEAQRPRSAPVDGRKKLPACRDSVKLVYAVVTEKGNTDPSAARRAWLLAIQHVFPGEALDWPVLPDAWQEPFEGALNELDALLPAAKELVVQGLVIAVRADAVVSTEEAELLRVICGSMHCPLPL